MNYAPIARIFLRYAVGAVIGMAQAEVLAADADIVSAVAVLIGVGVEAAYAWAKKRGGAT